MRRSSAPFLRSGRPCRGARHLPMLGLMLLVAAWGTHPFPGLGSSPSLSPGDFAPFGLSPLGPMGWIAGHVTPANASIWIGSHSVAVDSDGTFHAATSPGPHELTAKATGYLDQTMGFVVRAGETNWTTIALVALPTPTSTSVPSLSLATLAPGLELDAVVLVGIAMVFLMATRRRR